MTRDDHQHGGQHLLPSIIGIMMIMVTIIVIMPMLKRRLPWLALEAAQSYPLYDDMYHPSYEPLLALKRRA